MKIAIDVSPLESGHYLQHRVRGTGFYLTNLKESLSKYYPENEYSFFKRGEDVNPNVDLVHYPYFEPFFLTLPLFKRGKTVVTVHDLTPLVFKENFPSGLRGKLKWELQKNSLKQIDAVITDSHSSKKDIHKFTGFSADKIHVVYLAAADHFKKISKPSKEVIEKYHLSDEFILYVGDVTWNKNLPNLIEAVNKTNFKLVIAGSAFVNKDYDRNNPWNKDLYEAQVLAESNKNIIPIGFASDNELVNLYNLATTFIMPSRYEGFGLPALEAMQSGTPVITTKKGSIEEVVDSSAYFVDPEDVSSISNGIREVMENTSLRNALSEKGLIQAKKFTWEKTAKETIKVYEKIIRE